MFLVRMRKKLIERGRAKKRVRAKTESEPKERRESEPKREESQNQREKRVRTREKRIMQESDRYRRWFGFWHRLLSGKVYLFKTFPDSNTC